MNENGLEDFEETIRQRRNRSIWAYLLTDDDDEDDDNDDDNCYYYYYYDDDEDDGDVDFGYFVLEFCVKGNVLKALCSFATRLALGKYMCLQVTV